MKLTELIEHLKIGGRGKKKDWKDGEVWFCNTSEGWVETNINMRSIGYPQGDYFMSLFDTFEYDGWEKV